MLLNKILPFSYMALLSLSLTSCGPVETTRIKYEDSYVEESTGEAFILKYDASECDESDYYRFKLFTAYKDYKNVEYYPDTNEQGAFSISKTSLLKKEMLFGGKLINRLTLHTSTNKITSKRIIKRKADHKSFCLGKDYSESDSLDAVGVKVDATLKMVETKLKETSLLKYLRPINIRIHPEYTIEEKVQGRASSSTKAKTLINNALFNYEYNEMVILPQGKNLNGIVPFNGVPLWDIPLVTSHEYGHYVFSTLYPNYFSNVAPYKISRAHLCYNPAGHGASMHAVDPENNEEDKEKEKDKEKDKDKKENNTETTKTNFEFKPVVKSSQENSQKRNGSSIEEVNNVDTASFTRRVDEHTVIGALNEGFADLFARYTMDDQYTVNGLGCLSLTRDVYSKNFLSGEEKIFSQELVDSFTSNTKESSESCYRKANFQSLHVVGSVLAHGIDLLYTKLSLTKAQKLTELTKWVRAINRSHQHLLSLSSAQALNYYAFLAFSNAKKQFPDSQVDILEIYSSNFPMANALYPL